MADQSNIFDIGGASTEVWLTTWGSSLYDTDGITPLTTHVGGYQEAWIDTQASQLNAQAHYSRLFSAEHWLNQWDIVSPNWRVVPQLGGTALVYNQTPDAPMQTLCFGRVQTKANGNDIPDICVPDEGDLYAPPLTSYIQTDVNVGPSIPGGAGGSTETLPTANGQPLFENIAVGGTGVPDLPIGTQQQLAHTDTPFKPSSVDFIARRKVGSTTWANDYITNIIQKIGIELRNVWDMSSPISDGRTYIRNFGPSWGNTTYAGPQFSQEGSIGNLRVKVTANKGSATMRRIATLDKCIGRDVRYRWIFPYVDKGGYLSHEVQRSRCVGVETGIGEGGKELESDGPPPNVGFILKMDVTSEASRGSFFGSGGGSPQVKIMWGGNVNRGARSAEHASWADGFEVYVTPDKTPYLTYWDGVKTAKAFLARSPISDLSQVTLRVEYFGTSMLVTLNENDGGSALVKGYTQMKTKEIRKGVYVTNNSVAFQISNCTATFSCMPIYYNPWSTTQAADFVSGDVADPSSWGNDPTSGVNEKLEFRYWQQQDDENVMALFYSGMAKLASLAMFHLPPAQETSQAQAQATVLVDKVMRNLALQTPNTRDIYEQTKSWSNSQADAVMPYYHQDEGWPPFIRDSRQMPCNGGIASSPLQLTSTNIPDLAEIDSYSWFPSIPQTQADSDWPIGAGGPTMLSTDSTTISLIFSANVTHTTPLIFGFKADGVHDKLPFRNSSGDAAPHAERLRAMSWTAKWSAGSGEAGTVGKVMRATAEVMVIEPSAEAIFALANNQMRLIIKNTGYRDTSLATDPAQGVLGKALYLNGTLFDGITTHIFISRTSSGKVVLTIRASDPVMMLDRTMLESNLRFDGNSYVTAICSLMRHTDYVNMFEIRFGPKGQPGVDVGPTWMGTHRIDRLLSDLGLEGKIPYFGYQPGIGRVYEVGPGEMVMTHIANILQKMDSPIFIPLFYYDPTKSKFVLTRRLRSGGSSPNGLAGGAGGKLWLIDAPQGTNITNAWQATAVSGGLLLQAARGQSLYSLESTTDHLLSDYVAFGTNRITGSPQKGTAMNPNWNSLADGTRAKWGNTYGHIGYRAKVVEKQAANFLPDQTAVNGYTWGRMWWRSRAAMRITGLTVDGVVFPGSGGSGGGIDDGCLGVVIGNEAWPYTMLEEVTIKYDAEQQRVQSVLSVAVFPPSPPGSEYGQTPTDTHR